jgi:hypothetical protein
MILLGRALNKPKSEAVTNMRTGGDEPNICAPMSLNLGYVRKSSDRKAEKLPVQSSSNRLSDGCLANTWWTNKAYDLALHAPSKLSDGEEF